MPSRPARIAAFAGLGLLGLAALALGAAVAKRSALAEWFAVRELAARGVEARLRVVRLDLRGAELADVQLGVPAAPDLALESASMSWSVAGLRAGRLDRVALRGLRLRARIDDSGAHLGALDGLLASGASEAGAPLSLPFLEAELADAELSIDSPQGALQLRAEGNATPEGDLVRATFTLHGESSQGVLDFGGGGTVELASQEIGAAGALAGVTPWGHVEGNVRALGTLAAIPAGWFFGATGVAAAFLAATVAGTFFPIFAAYARRHSLAPGPLFAAIWLRSLVSGCVAATVSAALIARGWTGAASLGAAALGGVAGLLVAASFAAWRGRACSGDRLARRLWAGL